MVPNVVAKVALVAFVTVAPLVVAATGPPAPSALAVTAAEPVRWGPTQALTSRDTIDPDSLDVAVGTEGTVALAWMRRHHLLVAVRRPGRGWSSPKALSHHESLMWFHELDVAVDGRGQVTVVWASAKRGARSDRFDRVVSRTLPVRGAWGPAVVLNSLPRECCDEVASPSIAVNDRGDTVVAWQWWRDDWSGVSHVAAAYRPAGGHWQAPRRLLGRGAELAATLDRRGNAMVYAAPYGGNLQVVRRSVARGWMRPRVIGPEVDTVRAAATPSGAQVVLWSPESRARVWSRSLRQPGGRWTHKVLVGNGLLAALAMDGRGRAIVAFDDVSRGHLVRVARRTAGGRWRGRSLTGPGLPIRSVSAASDRNGDTVVTWLLGDSDAPPEVWASYRPSDGGFQAPVRLSAGRTHRVQALVSGVRSGGRGLVAWAGSQDEEPVWWGRVRVRQTVAPR